MKNKFNSIVNAISFDELTCLKTDDIRTNISAFARWIYKGHPSWPFWNKKVREAFKKKIADLYAQADSIHTTEELLKKLYTLALQTIPDRHFSISFNHKRVLSKEERLAIPHKILDDLVPNPKVGQNLAKQDLQTLKKLGMALYMREDLSNVGRAWLFVGEINPKIGIVACTNLTTYNPTTGKFSQEQYDKLTKMVNTIKEHYNHWEALIIDLRDNTGGDSRFFEKIASIVNGGTAQPISKRLWLRNTLENIQLMYEKPNISHQFNEKQLERLKHQKMAKILWASSETNPIKKKRKEIRILTNRLVQSSSEGAIFQLGKCPAYKTVGESTGGCIHGFNPVKIALPNNAIINIAILHSITPRFCPEGIGMPPDIPTPNKDAFEVALKDIQKKLKIS